MDRALESASACHRFKILKAECLALLGRYPEAQSVARYECTFEKRFIYLFDITGICHNEVNLNGDKKPLSCFTVDNTTLTIGKHRFYSLL